jgi:hypothetical protein
VASPFLHARFEPKLYERVLGAAEAEGVSLSAFLRMAVLEKLGTVDRLEAERAALLAEARAFLAVTPGTSAVDREAHGLVERYVAAIEAQAGRLSLFEQRGRARALQEIADGALQPLDGQELTFPEYRPDGPPVVLETTSPGRRGFLREELARARSRALLQAPPTSAPPPSAPGLLGEARTHELFNEALGWFGWRPVFCVQHGMVPCAPGSEGARCYLSCTITTGPEMA